MKEVYLASIGRLKGINGSKSQGLSQEAQRFSQEVVGEGVQTVPRRYVSHGVPAASCVGATARVRQRLAELRLKYSAAATHVCCLQPPRVFYACGSREKRLSVIDGLPYQIQALRCGARHVIAFSDVPIT
jgi:hypothetical protein